MLEWDWEGAEAAFRKAIEINPNLAGARAFYALHLSSMERPDEAQAQMERALALDRYNPWLRSANALTMCDDRRYAECIEEYRAALRIEPDYPMALFNLAGAYHRNGNFDESLAQLRRWFPGDQELDEALDRGYAEGGYRAAMRRYAETLAARPVAERICILIADVYARAGDTELTLEWFERAYQVHDPALPMNLILADRPELHGNPRFHALRRRVGLPETPQPETPQ
jgi:tetratricopeptide (TPR) repeat protein